MGGGAQQGLILDPAHTSGACIISQTTLHPRAFWMRMSRGVTDTGGAGEQRPHNPSMTEDVQAPTCLRSQGKAEPPSSDHRAGPHLPAQTQDRDMPPPQTPGQGRASPLRPQGGVLSPPLDPRTGPHLSPQTPRQGLASHLRPRTGPASPLRPQGRTLPLPPGQV